MSVQSSDPPAAAVPDGAMVRLITALPATASELDADRRLTDLIARIAPDLPRYVPH